MVGKEVNQKPMLQVGEPENLCPKYLFLRLDATPESSWRDRLSGSAASNTLQLFLTVNFNTQTFALKLGKAKFGIRAGKLQPTLSNRYL